MLKHMTRHHTASEAEMMSTLNKKEKSAFKKYLEKHPNAAKTQFDEAETRYLWKVWCKAVPAVLEGEFVGLPRGEISQISPSLSKVATQANEALVDQIFRVMDRSKDGMIDFEEWITTVSICTRGNLDEQLELTFLLFDSDENGTVDREEVRYLVTETGRFLEFVAKGMLSKAELSEQKEQMAQDIFMDTESLQMDVFKQRAMNNNVILNCFGLLEYLFGPVVQNMEFDLGRQKKMFKVSLQHVLNSQSARGKHWKVPEIIYKAVQYLREGGLKHEGLFRVSGNINELMALKNELDGGKEVDSIEWKPLLAADLIKSFLRELSEPLLTYAFYEPFILLGEQHDAETKLVKARSLVASLPDATIDLVEFLCNFFHEVSQHPENMMTVNNISVVFAPIFLRRKDADMERAMKETKQAISLLGYLIENHTAIFKDITSHNVIDNEEEDSFHAMEAADEEVFKMSYKILLSMVEGLEARVKSKNETIRQLQQQNRLLKEKVNELSRKSLSSSQANPTTPRGSHHHHGSKTEEESSHENLNKIGSKKEKKKKEKKEK